MPSFPRRPLLALAATPTLARAEGPAAILAAGAVKHAVEALLTAAHWPEGPPPAAFDTVGALRDRVLAGERPAVVLLSDPALDTLAARNLLAAGTRTSVGRTGVGLGVRAGSTLGAIDTPEALRAVLLAAQSIGWADPARGATAGTQFARAIDTLGIADSVRARGRVFPFGVEAVAAAARGEIEVAVSQATELHGRPGIRFLGYLPDPLQLWTGYAAAIVADSPVARRFLGLLATATGRAAFSAIGFRNE
jgi:molybdate transport system substrate-binding protein